MKYDREAGHHDHVLSCSIAQPAATARLPVASQSAVGQVRTLRVARNQDSGLRRLSHHRGASATLPPRIPIVPAVDRQPGTVYGVSIRPKLAIAWPEISSTYISLETSDLHGPRWADRRNGSGTFALLLSGFACSIRIGKILREFGQKFVRVLFFDKCLLEKFGDVGHFKLVCPRQKSTVASNLIVLNRLRRRD